MKFLIALFSCMYVCEGHGVLVWPPSNRHGGDMQTAGDCVNYQCMWFSQPVTIPGPPTLDPKFRTYNVGVNGGAYDWTKTHPWRSPGSAPVLGCGCGVAGGNPVPLFNGGFNPPGVKQGTDGISLPAKRPYQWKRGAIEEVAWALTANHGGGYSYRLCKHTVNQTATEECFQKNPLRFAGETSWLQYGEFVPSQPRYSIPLVKVNKGTFPSGSEWARLPIPACKMCDQGKLCGTKFEPNMTDVSGQLPGGTNFYGGSAWINQEECGSTCSGATPFVNDSNLPPPINTNGTDYGLSDGLICPPGMTQFEELLPGLSGFLANHSYPEKSIIAFSIVDTIIVPDLPDGTYLLSWRWDCEQSSQVWQNCADIEILGEAPTPALTAEVDTWRLYFIISTSGIGFIAVAAILFACIQRQRGKIAASELRQPMIRKQSIQR